ncbi:hypothetical protein [Streptomyces sp. LN785]|uniref:hypothetical protein n=1 Tax=Streptomyces sp. LN785 TaxID=3112983 RepID=UPI0037153F1A
MEISIRATGHRGAGANAVSCGPTGAPVIRFAGERVDDPQDGRRKLVRVTPIGADVLVRSAEGFDRLRAERVRALGADRLRALESDLRVMAPADAFRLDAAA